VIVPNNTAFTEIVGENEERGYLVKAGGDIDHQVFLYGLTCNPRDIVHADDFLAKLEHVYAHRGEAEEKAWFAREWTLQHTKAKIGDKWKAFFADIENLMVKEVTCEA
jgi:hypothetical protein